MRAVTHSTQSSRKHVERKCDSSMSHVERKCNSRGYLTNWAQEDKYLSIKSHPYTQKEAA